jgi:hypothetical protein
MLRILGKISIFGTMAGLDQLVSVGPISDSILQQVGALRKNPDTDLFCYGSPWYSFRADALDEEVRNFLVANARLGDVLAVRDPGIRYAIFTLCPVNESYEETFACLFSQETLQVLLGLGLALEIAPASVMPAAAYWIPDPALRGP